MYACRFCPSTFNKKFNLQRHIRLKHGENTHNVETCTNGVETLTNGGNETIQASTVACPYRQITADEMSYKRFIGPTAINVSGTTNSGKSYFVKRLLQSKSDMFNPPVNKILYCYGVWQSLYDRMEDDDKLGIMFNNGLPSKETLDSFVDGNHNIIVLDDLMHDVISSKETQDLFTRGSHHKNVTIIYINQNMFSQGKCARTIALNCHYFILMRNMRDVFQINVLAKQTGLGTDLVRAYKECTSEAYGYLVLCLHPHTSCEIKLKTHIFPDEDTIVYI